jgi:hypothetical protein
MHYVKLRWSERKIIMWLFQSHKFQITAIGGEQETQTGSCGFLRYRKNEQSRGCAPAMYKGRIGDQAVNQAAAPKPGLFAHAGRAEWL